MSIDLYNTDNTGLLLNVPMAPSTGFFEITKNAGTVRNQGIEYRLDATIIKNKAWKWDLGFNIGFNKNRVIYLPNHTSFLQSANAVNQQVKEGQDINKLIKDLYPDAKEIASNLPEITIATRNPDEVGRARDLNGTDVGIIRGKFGVAENACVWIPQTMKEKAICFISENLVILLPKSQIVNNMHEAYKRIEFDKTYDGYGTFISGPSKTADIAQVLVMGAQAARSATILLLPE
jgi:L-lactate dehydrogenase complex protein LldG